jgi:transcriptional regulator with XRE-family HTH domain
VTQAELADEAGTSQPTIAAYEAGHKSPTLRTLDRLARAVGREVVVSFVPSMTREDRRSLFLHRAISEVLRRSPEETIAHARRNLGHMIELHPGARVLLGEWDRILERPIEEIIAVLIDPAMSARDLRQVTPFAGVLSTSERTRVYRMFGENERSHDQG